MASKVVIIRIDAKVFKIVCKKKTIQIEVLKL